MPSFVRRAGGRGAFAPFADYCVLSMLGRMSTTILKPRYLLPIAPDDVVREDVGVAVEDGRIAAVEPFEELGAGFPTPRRSNSTRTY